MTVFITKVERECEEYPSLITVRDSKGSIINTFHNRLEFSHWCQLVGLRYQLRGSTYSKEGGVVEELVSSRGFRFLTVDNESNLPTNSIKCQRRVGYKIENCYLVVNDSETIVYRKRELPTFETVLLDKSYLKENMESNALLDLVLSIG